MAHARHGDGRPGADHVHARRTSPAARRPSATPRRRSTPCSPDASARSPARGGSTPTGKYVYNGPSRQEARLREWDFFIQDSWKVKPNLSLNAGLRYANQLPIYSKFGCYSTATLDDIWGFSGNKPGCDPSAPTKETCNLFARATMPGKVPTYLNLGAGVSRTTRTRTTWAPTIGVNWTPSAESGFLRTLLGQQGDTSISGGWSRGFERRDMERLRGLPRRQPGPDDEREPQRQQRQPRPAAVAAARAATSVRRRPARRS